MESKREKRLLFVACFLSLLAAAVGFVFRSMVPTLWGRHFELSATEVGMLFGASLWPLAIVMILFSLVVDRIGYRVSMFIAFVLQALSVVLTVTATSERALWVACLAAGCGHGVVEAIINPLCASLYRREKAKMLNILHAAWPMGVVLGGALFLTNYQRVGTWLEARGVFWFMLVPVAVYGIIFMRVKRFPGDERVEGNVSTFDMLREFGGLGAFLALTFLSYEFASQAGLGGARDRLLACLGVGLIGGAAFGFVVRSAGRWLFFVLCLVMIPLAATELGTDGWIKNLMEPSMGEHAGWALVVSAAIMMVLRFFAGIPLRWLSPPGLLLASSVFSVVGLFSLSLSSGVVVFFAFFCYAVGQTFYWPTVLGMVSEQFPRGGAMTINTVSAMGLLTVGVFGLPFLGAVQDGYNARAMTEVKPALVDAIRSEHRSFGRPGEKKPIAEDKSLFGIDYAAINTEAFLEQPELSVAERTRLRGLLTNTGRSTLRVAAILPAVMAVVFLFIVLDFRRRGGYRPVALPAVAPLPGRARPSARPDEASGLAIDPSV